MTSTSGSLRLQKHLLLIRALALVAAGLLGWAAPTEAAEIEGVTFNDEIRASTDPELTLVLRGMGLLRYRVVFRGYVAALYLPRGVASSRVLEDVPRRLELSYFWSIAGSDFADAADQTLARDLSEADLEALRPRIDSLHEAYRDVRPNDRYSLTYLPGTGTELRLNGDLLATIRGQDFAQAYFGIWLGERPLDEDLRDDLLGSR